MKKKQEIVATQTQEVAVTNEFDLMIAKAIDKNVPVETMEKLLAMRKSLKEEQAKAEYNKALAEMQHECPPITKSKSVMEKDNAKVRYKYAPLDDVISQVKDLLHKYGFSYSFNSRSKKENEKIQIITCTARHIGGHSETAEFELPIDSNTFMSEIQRHGSTLSYAKRYAFCEVFGFVPSGEDNDGQDKEKGESKNAPMTPEQKEEIEKRLATKTIGMPEANYKMITETYLSYTKAKADTCVKWWDKEVEKANKKTSSQPDDKRGKETPQNENSGTPEPLTTDQFPLIENARKSRYLQFATVFEQTLIRNAQTKKQGIVAINLWYGTEENSIHIAGLREKLVKDHPETEKKPKPAKVDPKSQDVVKLYDKLVAKKVLCSKCKRPTVPELNEKGQFVMNEEGDCYSFVCECGAKKWVLA